MIIRRALLSDLPEVVRLFAEYLKFYQKENDPVRIREFLYARFDKNESVIFVCDSGSGPLSGLLQLYPAFSSLTLKKSLILNDLFVDPTYREKGVGAALLKAAQDYSKESGSEGLSLQTSVTNRKAQALYEKCGWVKDTEFLTYHFTH